MEPHDEAASDAPVTVRFKLVPRHMPTHAADRAALIKTLQSDLADAANITHDRLVRRVPIAFDLELQSFGCV